MNCFTSGWVNAGDSAGTTQKQVFTFMDCSYLVFHRCSIEALIHTDSPFIHRKVQNKEIICSSGAVTVNKLPRLKERWAFHLSSSVKRLSAKSFWISSMAVGCQRNLTLSATAELKPEERRENNERSEDIAQTLAACGRRSLSQKKYVKYGGLSARIY